MAHLEQRQFFESVRELYPQFFNNVRVLDCGSLDVNGNLKEFFIDSDYTGVDIVTGKNVDIVSKVHELDFKDESFDVVVSAEMLEHDEYWEQSLKKMYSLARSGGLIAISCAGENRPEHGTLRSNGQEWGTGDYYKNLTPKDLKKVLKKSMFNDWKFSENHDVHDTYFVGIKR
jgi:SAM-dependent methyltransferase